MSNGMLKVGVWGVAMFCALVGLLAVYYGFTTIYSYSGFTSIFVGVAIIMIAIGLIKKHQIARIGAYIVFVMSGLKYAFWLYIVLRPNEDGKVSSFSILEYLCVSYLLLAIASIWFLSLKSTRGYFSDRRI
ncbi:MAG: hypothetical protein P8X88_09130 [Gammaproteobacteria bacterium]